MPPPSLLVVDDDQEVCAIIGRVAKQLGYEIVAATEAKTAVSLYERLIPDVIIVDMIAPDINELQILGHLALVGCRSRILVISGYGPLYLYQAQQLDDLLSMMPLQTMHKPITIAGLREFLGCHSEDLSKQHSHA